MQPGAEKWWATSPSPGGWKSGDFCCQGPTEHPFCCCGFISAHLGLCTHHLGPAGGPAAFFTRDYAQIAFHSSPEDSLLSCSGNKGPAEDPQDGGRGENESHICRKERGNSSLPGEMGVVLCLHWLRYTMAEMLFLTTEPVAAVC